MSEFSTESFSSPQELGQEAVCRIYFREDMFPYSAIEPADVSELKQILAEAGFRMGYWENYRTGLTCRVDCPADSAAGLTEFLAGQGYWVMLPPIIGPSSETLPANT